MYDYVQLCMTMYEYVWLGMTIYACGWLCMAMYDFVKVLTRYHKFLHVLTSSYMLSSCQNFKMLDFEDSSTFRGACFSRSGHFSYSICHP